MSVKVNIHQNFRHLTNDLSTIEVNGKTVGECLNDLINQFPNLRKFAKRKGFVLTLMEKRSILVHQKNKGAREACILLKGG